MHLEAAIDFWGTDQGILQRIDGLAQDLHFHTVNGAFQMIVPTNGVRWLHWVTANDDRVCPRCIAKATGGRNGYYRVGWFTPKLPIHRFDRCQWELIFGEPP